MEMPIPTLLRQGKTITKNRLRPFVRGGMMVPNSAQTPVQTPAKSGDSNGRSAPLIIESPSDAYAEILSFIGDHGTAAAAVQKALKVRITDSLGNRILMNKPVPVWHMFGTQKQPFYLNEYSEPLIMEPLQCLTLEFENPSTAGAADFSPAVGVRYIQRSAWDEMNSKLRELQSRRKQVYPYWLTQEADLQIAAGGYLDALITVPNYLRMVITTVMAHFTSTGAAGETAEGFEVEMYDGDERMIQNRAVPSTCCSGYAALPYRLPVPMVVEPNTVLKLRFHNLITDQATNVFWSYFGVATDA